ncbi:hypothetical protein KGQ19_03670 [Catenulispora sp. NL8]|uniref:Uncharacterized protein n=1 Tax=Catenulispora pinistramenti TaxID=2705254 RepID=A0ABM8VDB3_9ACTN|nr:hypothetical protein [Catenulispora pinistramenti]MBS2545959.1 hypothetical protein [Catenulispora pinistramenti]
MKLTKLADPPDCGSDDCPAVYVTDSGTIVVQGDAVSQAEGLRLGAGEQAVEISADLLREALRALGG